MEPLPLKDGAIQIWTDELDRELDRYPGKWVAHTRTKVVGVGDSAHEAATKARKLGFEDFFLWRLPRKDEEWFF